MSETVINLPYNNPDFFDDIQFSIEVKKLNIFSDILLEGEPELDGVVQSVDVEITATYDNDGETIIAQQSFAPGLPYPTDENGFTSYAQLTESQIISWLKEQESYNGYKNCLALNLQEQITRLSEPDLPWNSASS